MNNVFALYRDDVDSEQARDLIIKQREKSKIKQQEREKETLKFEEEAGAKKIVPSSIEAVKEISTGIGKEVALAIILIIIAIIFGKKLYTQFKRSK